MVVEEEEGTYTGIDWMEVRDGKINIQQGVGQGYRSSAMAR